jgi:exo-beta-1,3-glucanase (GH17 family)/cellulose synthase/poly-beta-1,6-N-acetylglucosamine synthase-like glycosyltransferase
MRLAAAVVALLACVHAGLWALTPAPSAAPDVTGPLASVSYTPFSDSSHPDSVQASADRIRADLRAIAPYTVAIRTYSSTGGVELVPPIAAEFGLKVTVGAWVDKCGVTPPDKIQEPDKWAGFAKECPNQAEKAEKAKAEKKEFVGRNEQEIRAAIELARKNHNVNAVVVGNETIYRGDMTAPEIIRLIQRVKREVQVPVTTGEIFSAWMDDREAARKDGRPALDAVVDYVAAHVLPYWEGTSDKAAVDDAIKRYFRLREAFPGKRVVIAEFGWPSAGYNRRAANPGRAEQAMVVRDFVSHAEALGIDYNIIEAFDQPWKTNEGSVGPYWGIFDATRHAKFGFTGPVVDGDHWRIAVVAVLIGFLLSLPILGLAEATLGQAALLAGAVHVIGAWCATVFAYWHGHYFVPGAAFALALGLALLAVLIVIGIAKVEEIAAITFGPKPRRLLDRAASSSGYAPKVSIHIPACREPPDMLKQTLDAVARLDYPNFECVIVINNTPDPAMWRPVEEHCATLGARFKFVNAENLKGFKAGALRLAIVHTAADAEIIGVIDADYAVHPDWLKDLVPGFVEPTLGLIQAPQDHRDGDRSVMHHAMNGEYAGFFDTGMIQRNENNAIIVHGTMCLIRRTALEGAGGWSSDTICEDTDLGLTILEHGWGIQYTNRRYGWGLLPDTYEAFKKQRYRWASGGAQILKKHWRRLLPGASRLTAEQKRDFVLGWINWLGAESVGVLVAILNLLWVPVIAFVGIAIPDTILTLPIIAAFVVSVLHFVTVYRMRVAIPIGQMLAAMFAAMSVQWTVARAVGDGVIKDRLPFVRTAKGGGVRRQDFPAFWEAVIGCLLVTGAVILLARNYERIREIYIFAGVLVVQSLPFVSAVAIALLEGSRLNDFAFWRSLEARFVELLPRRAAIAKAPATTDKTIETAP